MAANAMVARRRERNFYLLMALALAAITFIGFARTWFLRGLFPEVQSFVPPEAVFTLHGALATLWFAWLIAQVLLIRRGDYTLHRTMGYIGVLLAILLVTVGMYAASVAAARPGGFIGIPTPPEQFFAIPFFDLVMFSLFFGCAVVARKNPQAHKRLVLFATINIIDAAVARIPLALITEYFPVSIYFGSWLLIAAVIAWDLVTLKRVHPVTLVASVLTLAMQFGRLAIMDTTAWLSFANRFIGILQGGA